VEAYVNHAHTPGASRAGAKRISTSRPRLPGLFFSAIDAPWARAMFLTMASPRPLPGVPAFDHLTNRSKTRSRIAAAMPEPESAMIIQACAPSTRQESETVPSCCVQRKPLSITLRNRIRKLSGSGRQRPGSICVEAQLQPGRDGLPSSMGSMPQKQAEFKPLSYALHELRCANLLASPRFTYLPGLPVCHQTGSDRWVITTRSKQCTR
jgi:hypothetical protein